MLLTAGSVFAASDARRAMKFGAEMAEQGNWREARYRWERALADEPDNGRLRNNLGVALEALGEIDAAFREYARALELDGRDERIRENAYRAKRFWTTQAGRSEDDLPPLDAGFDSRGGSTTGGRAKAEQVVVELPIPPRLDVSEAQSVLVASFLHRETDLLDVNRELVRYLRARISRRTPLEVVDATPPPAVPEQTLEDLARNQAFWSRLGREWDADIIVSGELSFDRRDASGFEDVDSVSPVTGQKVRRSQFVEQEEFTFVVEILFLEGRIGGLLHHDRFRRQVRFRGQMNDPITAFHELCETIADDVVSVVRTRTRQDVRTVFSR